MSEHPEPLAEEIAEQINRPVTAPVRIHVHKAGLLTSVQNLGRHGQRHLGVCQAGALDPLAFRVANRLVGNPEACAGLEITVGQQVVLSFSAATRIALSGADCAATLDGTPLHACHSVSVTPGQRLTLHTTSRGMRAYLAVAGGIVVPSVLASPSTDLQSGFGGLQGRALRDGDVLTAGDAAWLDAPPFGVKAPEWCDFAQVRSVQPVSREYVRNGAEACMVRLLRGPDYASFTPAAHRALWQGEWTITANSNRMGYRLSGPTLERREHTDLLSHAVLPGTLQVPPNGQPILLMGDAQTAGGYPRIGAVISADLWRLAQRRAGTPVRFVECSLADARAALHKIERYLRQLDLAVRMERERALRTA